MEAAITALDGEKDPRCLLRGLSLLSSTISLYSTQPEHSLAYGKLEESVDEAFDVLSCYFPIDFTPPPNDPYGISKEMLRAELQGAMVSCPLFVDQLVSLALEKLSSAVRNAKVDALDVLALSAERLASSTNNSTAAAAAAIYDKGREMYLNQLSAIWAAIKLEIQSLADNNSDSSGGGGGGHTLPSSSTSKRQPLLLANATTTASRIFKSFPTHQPLIDLVLKDASITEDLISCLASPVPNQESETFHRSVGKIQASTAALSVLTLCGGEPRRQALSLVLPRIINILDTGNIKKEEKGRKDIESQVLCWTVIASLLQGEERGEGEEIQGILKKVFHMSLRQEEELEEKGGDEMKVDENEEEEEDSTDNEMIYWSREASEYNVVRLETQKLAALAAICATLGNASQMSGGDGDVEQAVAHVLKLISTNNANSSSSRNSLKSQAVCVLYSIVTTRSDLSERVMQALMEAGNISAIQMLFRRTTTAAAAACRASHGLQVQIIAAFDQAIVEHLLKTSQAEETSEKNKLKLVELTRGLHNIIEDATMDKSGVDSSSVKEDGLGRAFSSLGSHIYQALLQTQHTTTNDDDVDGCVMIIYQSFLAAAAAAPSGMGDGTSTNSTAFDTALETSLTMLSSQTFNSKSSMAACCAVICASPSTILQQAWQKTSTAVNTSSNLVTLLVNTAVPITTTTAAAVAAHSPIYVKKWASLAAASLLNKAVSKEDVDVFCDSAFNTFLSASSKDKNTDDYYWKCVADVTRSLAMRGAHKSSDKLLTQIILHPSSASVSDVYNAISCLETILSPSTSTTSTQNLMVSRSLWQQRFYSVAMNKVLKMQQQEGEEEGVMLFMAALIKNGPEKAVMQDLTRLGHQLPPLLASLAFLSKEDDLSIDSNSATCICHLLLGVLSFINKGLAADKASLFLPIMNSLLAQLISLATTFNPVSTVRKSAFDLLALIGMKVEYSQLHGYKSQVVEAAIAGLDDAKRHVRRAAAACRLAWV